MIQQRLRQLVQENNCGAEGIVIDAFQLEMTEQGWRDARLHCPRETGVYLHVTETGIPLRVGIAIGQEGIYGRWFHSRTCHLYSFIQKPMLPGNYRNFFMQIREQYPRTSVWYILLNSCQARVMEKIMCRTLIPLWEVRDIEHRYAWRDTQCWKDNPVDLEAVRLLRECQVDRSWLYL